MVSSWEDFYAKHPPPQDLIQNEKTLKEFIKKQLDKDTKVVLVTVGSAILYYKYNCFAREIFKLFLYIYRAVVQRYP